ncbi:MAG: cyanophycinase [Clostridiaceae bacterium]|jgi:cyanophycinase|nr:cyanophycinase [Clostridiaceae bacterium]
MNTGNLIIIGGAEDKAGECLILKSFVNLSGASKAKIIIITTATENAAEAGNQYKSLFVGMGAQETTFLDINSRDDADHEMNAGLISASTGIFFTGGDQLRITSILGGTKVYDALHGAYKSGAVIAGTSAGASAMSRTMIVDGNNNDAARKCTLKMAPGLGLLERALIDQHFHQRGRIGRLLCGVAENPSILGIGIDEDTAVRVFPDDHFEVLGSNSVTVVDGRNIKNSNVSELKPDENLAISNVVLHVLPAGYGYDLAERKVIKVRGRFCTGSSPL